MTAHASNLEALAAAPNVLNLLALEGGKPAIELGRDLLEVTDEAIDALANADAEIFHRGGVLAHVVREESTVGGIVRTDGSARIVPLPDARLRELLSRVADFYTTSRDESGAPRRKSRVVPPWVSKTIAARGHWPLLRPLVGVTDTPVLRADGTIVCTPGYDAATGLLYMPSGELFELPDAPTQAEALAARDALLETICDFPFAGEAHRSAWLAMLLTVLARSAFSGPAPLFLVDASTRGSGKTLLAETAARIALGRSIPRMAQAENDAEERKRITAISLAGDRVVLIDNISRPLGTPSLDAALTSDSWKDRLLNSNTSYEGPLMATWIATGNNVALAGDTARRTCLIRLVSEHEEPERRQGFRHPDLGAWITANRARLVVAGLTILRAYCMAGKPRQAVAPWGSFEGWNGLIPHAVMWVGMSDPNATRIELAEFADVERSAIADLFAGLAAFGADRRGVTVAEVLEALKGSEYRQLRDAVLELVPSKDGGLPTPRALGAKLRRLRDRVVGGRRLVKADGKTAAGTAWRIQSLSKNDCSDCSDSSIGQRKLEGGKKIQWTLADSLESLQSLGTVGWDHEAMTRMVDQAVEALAVAPRGAANLAFERMNEELAEAEKARDLEAVRAACRRAIQGANAPTEQGVAP